MHIRWRQYELIFAGSFFLLMGYKALTKIGNGIHTDAYVLPVSWHYTAEWLLTYGVPLLLLLVVNGWLLPRYLYSSHQLVVFLGASIGCFTILAAANASLHNLHLHYQLEHGTAKMPTPGKWQKERQQGISWAAGITVIYFLYLWVRESIIRWLNQQRKNNIIKVKACNHISAIAFLYAGLLALLQVVVKPEKDIAGIIYVFFIPAVVITILINLYVLFPYQSREKGAAYSFFIKLLITPLILSLVTGFVFILLTAGLPMLLLSLQFFIVVIVATPVSWLLFIQQKQRFLALQQLQKDLDKTTADLALLQSQINPHFLFNTLNTLYGTALQENAPRTSTGIQRLGDMMRFLLHDNHRDQIPLAREIDYLHNYIALQQLRIVQSKDISIETNIRGCSNERLIAPMLLIPFVENAFKHGIRLTTSSWVRIHFYCDATGVYLDVVNSAHTKRNEDAMSPHSGVGLQNVQQRLQLLYPGRHTLVIHHNEITFDVHLHITIPAGK